MSHTHLQRTKSTISKILNRVRDWYVPHQFIAKKSVQQETLGMSAIRLTTGSNRIHDKNTNKYIHIY